MKALKCKSTLIALLLVVSIQLSAQDNPLQQLLHFIVERDFRFQKKEEFRISIAIDPGASINEKGFNQITDIEYLHKWVYVKLGVQTFDALVGGYADFQGGVGLNFTSGYLDKERYYIGFKVGHIWRGKSEQFGDEDGYPVHGFEIGYDRFIENSDVYFGAKITYDWREDMLYSGADPLFRRSFYIKIGYKFVNKKYEH